MVFKGRNIWILVIVIYLGFVFTSLLRTTKAESGLGAVKTLTTAFMYPTQEPEEKDTSPWSYGGGLNRIVPDKTIILDYHHGPIMTGTNDILKLNVIFYGTFSYKQNTTLQLFFKSFGSGKCELQDSNGWPTVANWCQITRGYLDLHKTPVARCIVPGEKMTDNYSMGKNLKQSNIQALVLRAMKQKDIGADARNMYLVLTANDVLVEKFCMCGTHFYVFPSDTGNSQMGPYGWVGNPGKQCPRLCSWPYALGDLVKKALIPPNGDVGIDGIIITISSILASMASSPYNSGYYQGGKWSWSLWGLPTYIRNWFVFWLSRRATH